MIPNENIIKLFHQEAEILTAQEAISEEEKERIFKVLEESLENQYLNANQIYSKIVGEEGRV